MYRYFYGLKILITINLRTKVLSSIPVFTLFSIFNFHFSVWTLVLVHCISGICHQPSKILSDIEWSHNKPSFTHFFSDFLILHQCHVFFFLKVKVPIDNIVPIFLSILLLLIMFIWIHKFMIVPSFLYYFITVEQIHVLPPFPHLTVG